MRRGRLAEAEAGGGVWDPGTQRCHARGPCEEDCGRAVPSADLSFLPLFSAPYSSQTPSSSPIPRAACLVWTRWASSLIGSPRDPLPFIPGPTAPSL